jgi:hypothetical protein
MGGALEWERGALEGVINNIQVSSFVCSIFLKTCTFFVKNFLIKSTLVTLMPETELFTLHSG